MKKLHFLFFLSVLTTAFLLGGCAKEGPAGPAGATGATGATGPQGPAGNANVIGTTPITIGNSWVQAGTAWTVELNAAGVTQAIVDRGSVQGFKQYGTYWYPLPDINGDNQTTFGFTLGKILIFNSNQTGATTNPFTVYGSQTFRFVYITASNKIAHPNTNWRNWDEVKEALNIEE